MKHVVAVLVGFAVLIILVGMPKASAQNKNEEVEVKIQHYTHAGCTIAGQRYLPRYTSNGLIATFWIPRQKRNCLDMIARSRATCEWARAFQSINPDGRPWEPGEKDSRCLGVFMNEIPRCINYYESQRPKCEGPRRESKKESSDCKFARQTMGSYESACQSGDENACGILPQALAYVDQACR